MRQSLRPFFGNFTKRSSFVKVTVKDFNPEDKESDHVLKKTIFVNITVDDFNHLTFFQLNIQEKSFLEYQGKPSDSSLPSYSTLEAVDVAIVDEEYEGFITEKFQRVCVS